MDANKKLIRSSFQTVSILLTFFLAMLMNPAAQDKAQEEIDRVIGTDRLPTFDDEPKLPYVSALAKEVFRWQQVAPFGTQLVIQCILPSQVGLTRLLVPQRSHIV
jgi:cytochrome P450